MSDWVTFPTDYRNREVETIVRALQAGESVSVVGLSGAGKSNLLGFIARRARAPGIELVLADCNRLEGTSPAAVWGLIAQAMGAATRLEMDLSQVEALISERLNTTDGSLGLLIDRFDVLQDPPQPALYNNLRVLRDAHKYRLAFVAATRAPFDPASELAELFYAHTIWLGPLSDLDALWNVRRYAGRIGHEWDPATVEALIEISGAYPSLLRAVCEAHGEGALPDLASLSAHPAVRRRVAEFWRDSPGEAALEASGLKDLPLLKSGMPTEVDPTGLTAKEQLLYEYLRAHRGQVCSKDSLIKAVWPEDRIFEAGVRDDSLAQLVRRLRVKVEADPADPQRIKTVPGRGYVFSPTQGE